MGKEKDLSGGIEPMSKRKKGYLSESKVRIGGNRNRFGEEFFEKLGRNDPCICGSRRKFRNCCMGNSSANPGDDYFRETNLI